jgi:hypothetical protein
MASGEGGGADADSRAGSLLTGRSRRENGRSGPLDEAWEASDPQGGRVYAKTSTGHLWLPGRGCRTEPPSSCLCVEEFAKTMRAHRFRRMARSQARRPMTTGSATRSTRRIGVGCAAAGRPGGSSSHLSMASSAAGQVVAVPTIVRQNSEASHLLGSQAPRLVRGRTVPECSVKAARSCRSPDRPPNAQ